MSRAEQGQLRRWIDIDRGYPDDGQTLFFIVSISSYDKETEARDIANIIPCSEGLGEYTLKISVDYIERNSVVVA
jgi:hypothetical protein